MANPSVHESAGGRLLVDQPAPNVVRLTVSNPAKRNALDQQVLDAIVAALARNAARCVIVTGTGGMFSAGYDIGETPDDLFADRAERLVAHPFTGAIDALEAYPYPTVAALSGHAIGGGLELALACDLRIAAAGIRLGMPPARLGLVYSHTGVRRFIDAIGAPRTREMFLLGRQIDASTALAWGLINCVVAEDELESASVALARELARNSPVALRGNKRLIAALMAARNSLDPNLEQELIRLRKASFESRDILEGVRAFVEKRPPRWPDA